MLLLFLLSSRRMHKLLNDLVLQFVYMLEKYKLHTVITNCNHIITHKKTFVKGVFKINSERFKNFYFWVSLGAIALTAMGVDAETLTSWQNVYIAIKNLVSNPFLLATTIIAVVGVFVDPTTPGIADKIDKRTKSYKNKKGVK